MKDACVNVIDEEKYRSPNFDRRRLPISIIVIHYTAVSLRETFRIFRDKRIAQQEGCGRVSAHYVVDRTGEIYRVVDEKARAWHAGRGCWQGISDVNSASVGIELICKPNERFEHEQIQSLISLCKDIKNRYCIQWVIGHSDIAFMRGKRDPGPEFPWGQLGVQGIGLWPKRKCGSELTTEEKDRLLAKFGAARMLEEIGYNVRSDGCVLKDSMAAFALRYCPEHFAANVTENVEVLRRIADVYDWQKRSIKADLYMGVWLKMRLAQVEGVIGGDSDEKNGKDHRRDRYSFMKPDAERNYCAAKFEEIFGRYGISLADYLAHRSLIPIAEISWAFRLDDAIPDRMLFRRITDRICELMWCGGDGAFGKITWLLMAVEVFIYREWSVDSVSQILEVVEFIGEFLHEQRDRQTEGLAEFGDWDRMPAHRRWWLWLGWLMARLPRDNDTHICGSRKAALAAFRPWCMLLRIKALRHKLFQVRHMSDSSPILIDQIKANIRKSFRECIAEGEEHLKHVERCHGGRRKVGSRADLKDLGTSVIYARMVMAGIYENRARYLCFSSDENDFRELDDILRKALELCYANVVVDVVKVACQQKSEMKKRILLDSVRRLLPLVSDVFFTRARERDYWKRARSKNQKEAECGRLEVLKLLDKSLYAGWPIYESAMSKRNSKLGENRRLRGAVKHLGKFARKLGFYAWYYFRYRQQFDRQKVVGNVVKRGWEESLGAARRAFDMMGLTLPWEDCGVEMAEKLYEKTYWDFEMFLWLELYRRVASYSYDEKNGRWCCIGQAGMTPIQVCAEIVLLYTELTYHAHHDGMSEGWSDCRGWAYNILKTKLKVCQRLREPRKGKLSDWEQLRLAQEVLLDCEIRWRNGWDDVRPGDLRRSGFLRWVKDLDVSGRKGSADEKAIRTFINLVADDFMRLEKEASANLDGFYRGILRREGEVPAPRVVAEFVVTHILGRKKPSSPSQCAKIKFENPKIRIVDTYRDDLVGKGDYGFLMESIQRCRPDLGADRALATALGIRDTEFNKKKNSPRKGGWNTRAWRPEEIARAADLLGWELYEVEQEKNRPHRQMRRGRHQLDDVTGKLVRRLRSLSCTEEESILAHAVVRAMKQDLDEHLVSPDQFVGKNFVTGDSEIPRQFYEWRLAVVGWEGLQDFLLPWGVNSADKFHLLEDIFVRADLEKRSLVAARVELLKRMSDLSESRPSWMDDAVDLLFLGFRCEQVLQQHKDLTVEEQSCFLSLSDSCYKLFEHNEVKKKWKGFEAFCRLRSHRRGRHC